jgi:hypothetical protein
MIQTAIYGPGMRVKIRRGAFPMDAAIVGRPGLIVALNGYTPVRYGVTLDGENEIREFAEDEVTPLEGEERPEGELGATGPTVGPAPSGGSGGQH